jgi:hypothetical protein
MVKVRRQEYMYALTMRAAPRRMLKGAPRIARTPALPHRLRRAPHRSFRSVRDAA